jgi:resuscitation-promoting factor RpfA
VHPRLRIAVLIVAVLAVLAPLGVAAPASAVTQRTWGRLAQCESSRRWHLNTGNGYYGGLQFSAPTWRAFGGRRFAHNAHRATRLQQIRVATRVKRVQGWRAWPYCSRKIGLR